MILPPKYLKGAPGSPITIRALHDGKVLIDGEAGQRPVLLDRNDWLVIDGIDACCSSASVIELVHSGNNVVRRVVGWDAKDGNGGIFGAHYATGPNLFEDVAGFGTARKIFSVSQGGNDTTVRRAWGRWEKSTAIGPKLTYSLAYNSYRMTCENCLGTWSGQGMPETYVLMDYKGKPAKRGGERKLRQLRRGPALRDFRRRSKRQGQERRCEAARQSRLRPPERQVQEPARRLLHQVRLHRAQGRGRLPSSRESIRGDPLRPLRPVAARFFDEARCLGTHRIRRRTQPHSDPVEGRQRADRCFARHDLCSRREHLQHVAGRQPLLPLSGRSQDHPAALAVADESAHQGARLPGPAARPWTSTRTIAELFGPVPASCRAPDPSAAPGPSAVPTPIPE